MSYLSELRMVPEPLPATHPSSPLLAPGPPSVDGQPDSPRRRSHGGRGHSPTGKSRGSESKSREPGGRRARTKDRGPSTADSMLTLMLAEEERNSSNLKALLQITRDRLETETRRADAAESRAMLAEARTREVTSRSTTIEQASHRSELDAARAQEETKRAQMQLETAERELRRVTAELQRVTRQKDEADNGAAKARDLARKWQSALRDYQAHDEGRQEGIRLALIRRYDDGKEDGWEEGHTEGWDAGREEGFEEGRKTGFEEGREMGRREEQRYAAQVVRPHRWKDVPPRSFEGSERVYPDRSLFSKARSEVRRSLFSCKVNTLIVNTFPSPAGYTAELRSDSDMGGISSG
jgi:Essential protein Yae1, N terminal